jgi:hypothetical protein
VEWFSMRPPSLVLNDHVIGVPCDRELARNIERISCRSQPVGSASPNTFMSALPSGSLNLYGLAEAEL